MTNVARIGLLSDSHGRAAVTQRAVDLLLEHGAGMLVHLGDVGGIEVIDALVTAAPGGDQPVEAHLVFGNCDWDAASLASYAASVGVIVDHPQGRLEPDGQGVLVFMHGHNHRAMAEALARQVRWLCHGHTHERLDVRRGPTRIINPGALHRAATYSVALLETETDELAFFTVPKAG